MQLEKLMTNPYSWLFLSICTVVAFIFAIYTWFAGKKKKEFSYMKNSYKIVEEGKSCIPELKLLYRNQNISNLSITKYAIWNSGNEVINYADIVKDRPLQIMSVNDKTSILDMAIISESDETNKFKINRGKEGTRVVSFDYVESKEGIVIQIAHTGTSEDIIIKGKIKGGKNLKNLGDKDSVKLVNGKRRKKFSTILMIVDVILYTILFVMAGGMAWGIIPLDYTAVNTNLHNATMPERICVIVMGVLLIFMYHMIWRNIKKIYHIDIPSKLRDGFAYDKYED